MKLKEEQIAKIKLLLAEGASISDIQKYITEELSVTITFMDTRFLLDDLDLELKREEDKVVEEKKADDLDISKKEIAQGVQVELSPIQELGTLASGSVVFSDGVSAKWFLDEQGQLGVSGAPAGYSPTQEDAVQFQNTLREMLQNRI